MKDHIKFCLRKGERIRYYDFYENPKLMYWYHVLSRYKRRYGGFIWFTRQGNIHEFEYLP